MVSLEDLNKSNLFFKFVAFTFSVNFPIVEESAISEFFFFAFVSKRVLVQNYSYENVFRLDVHFHVNQAHFQMKCFPRELGLKQRHIVTRKWPTEAKPNCRILKLSPKF